MKKLIIFGFVALSLITVSCEGSNKTSPEEEVREFGKHFIEKIVANQLDSLSNSYADIILADTIIPIQSDSVIVTETAAGQYDVNLGEGVKIKLRRDDDGKITVTESFGLFSFPGEKVELAKKTGMWDESLNDARLAERIKDDAFFDYVKRSKTIKKSDILRVGSERFTDTDLIYPIINNSDFDIQGSDYTITIEESYPVDIPYSDPNNWVTSRKTIPGKTIKAHGTYNYVTEMAYGGRGGESVKSVNLKLTDEELQKMFAPYTGNEYQEYLASKR